MTGVERVNLIIKTGLAARVFEFGTAPVDEQGRPLFMPERSREDVGETVAGEVVEDAAAGLVRPPLTQTGQRRDVSKSADLDVRRESVERNQVFRLDL
jgi:hypothetical protein